MVSAELIHNPHLLQTTVKFNGQAPRINSQVEKYLNQTLKNWVHMIPAIFRDEMNGYDFDLSFTGTATDFMEVERAFKKAGVSETQVRLFLKNELEDADVKSAEIDELICWLSEHRNRKFDYDSFRRTNTDLLDGTYPYILIRGDASEPMNRQIGVETVKDADEIKGTLLTDTPILFYVEESTMTQFRADLIEIMQRKDICQAQLFFVFHPDVNAEQTKRVLVDLGLESPQIVSRADDELVMAYLRNYPVTEYIRRAIKVFESSVNEISDILDAESNESKLVNAEIHARIDNLEKIISGLKSADEYFTERDNYITPPKLFAIQEELNDRIQKWRNRKTKVVGEDESEAAAGEYGSDLQAFYLDFIDKLRSECNNTREDIFRRFKGRYAVQGFNKDFFPTGVLYKEPAMPEIPEIAPELIALRQISYEEPKSDLLSMFLKNTAMEDKSPVRIVTCFYEQWRSKAIELCTPIAGQCIEASTEALRHYYDELAEAYHIHLVDLISSQTKNKEKVSSQLSDDERKLQDDIDWLGEVKDKLSHIERG